MDIDLTEKQKHVISILPADKHELADELGVMPNTAKGHIEALREKGVDVPYDNGADVYHLAGETQEVRRISTKHKGSITREANEWATEQEAAILRRLRSKDALRANTVHESGNASLVVAMGDTHFGDRVERDTPTGPVEVFNSEIAAESVEHVTQTALAPAPL